MATRFKPVRGRPGSVSVGLDGVEAELLRGLLAELLEVIGDDADDGDELASMMGIGTATTLPDDPVLARLFPNGYSEDDEASADFRRYTERGLRERKRGHARTALASLSGAPGKIVLDADQAQAWLGALNDMRLAIGERVGITEDWEHAADALAEDDPRRYMLAVYDLLTWLQETLVRSLS